MPTPKKPWSRKELVKQGEVTHRKHRRLHNADNTQLYRRVKNSDHFSNWREFKRACGVNVPQRPAEYTRDEIIEMGKSAMNSDGVISGQDRKSLSDVVRESGHFGRTRTWTRFLEIIEAKGRSAQSEMKRQALIAEARSRIEPNGSLSGNKNKDLRDRSKRLFPKWNDLMTAVGAIGPWDRQQAVRRNQVLKLRLQGLNRNQIAERLDVTAQTIQKDLMFLADAVSPETRERIKIKGKGQFQPKIPRTEAKQRITKALRSSDGVLNFASIITDTGISYESVRKIVESSDFVVLGDGAQSLVFLKRGEHLNDLAARIEKLISRLRARLEKMPDPKKPFTRAQMNKAIKAYNRVYR